MIEGIAKKILDEKYITAEGIGTIIKKIEKSSLYTWRDLGDLDNNIGRVNITTDSYHTIVERLTNSIDACIEKKAEKYEEIKTFKNPSQVKNFLKEKGDLITPDDIIVGIYTNDKKKKVNLHFKDNGIGIENSNLPYTILKLNSSHKKEKDYLMGFYGQGGSSVCFHSRYTIIFTTNKNQNSFTIIRKNETENKYEYLVDMGNKDDAFAFNEKEHKPPEYRFLPPVLKNIEHFGTTIIHVEYDISKNVIADYQKIFEENMFKSIFKYTLHKPPREGDKNRQENWGIDGLGNKLYRNLDNRHIKSTQIKNILPNESIEITYYYLKTLETSTYLLATRGRGRRNIFLTSNGQTHYKMSSSIIKDVNLSRLEQKLIIEINCNKLSLNTKLNIFNSNRQDVNRETEVKIEDAIKNFISNDEFLIAENKRLEDELIKKELTKDNEALKQKFAEILKDYDEFAEFTIKVNKNQKPPLPKPPIDLFEMPTYFKIANKSNPIEAQFNKPCVINVESNIKDRSYKVNNYFIDIDESLKENIVFQTTDIKEGRGNVILTFDSVKIGQKINITLFLKSSGRKTLISNTREIRIIDEKESKPKENKGNSPNLEQVYKKDKAYKEFGWDKIERFGKYEDKSTIYVNMEHQDFEKFKEIIKSRNEDKVEIMKEEYFLNMAYSIFMVDENDVFQDSTLRNDLDPSKDNPVSIEDIEDASMSISAKLVFKLLKEKYKN